jgi:hypothetical protein
MISLALRLRVWLPVEAAMRGRCAAIRLEVGILYLAVISAVLAMSAPHVVAQELDARWLLGKWAGSGGADGRTAFQVVFKEHGGFEGYSRGQLGVANYRNGTWSFAGENVTVEYILDNPRQPQADGAKVTWALRREGEDLAGTGTGFKESANVVWRFDVRLRKSK